MRLSGAVRRHGVSAVETAIVLSVLLILLGGLIAGGTGAFRHQQVQCLACEGARWASTRAGDYQKDTAGPSPTAQQITDAAVLPKAVGIAPADLNVRVEWVDRSTGAVWDWDAAPKDVRSVTSSGEYVSNAVRVTVTYVWSPGVIWGQKVIGSVCELPLSN
ncbi:TadE/TadG family type IV pilus assembly protein [Gemmata sp. JC717]|uniref:TadE/TadG family type IV pilus assembly protein n=1 Tax=Gemmata algarum TaxID=2975278 RepID=UPI0021BAE6A6|nr:TadE/TadG family type IV pilus assembly protein [Gemmata algarum]MDY3554904.1 TadE/TadG family type IV pilus assembly protein [Gemmata algarum]